MTMPDLTTPKGLSITLGALLLVGGGAWGWSSVGSAERSTLPDELSVEALKQRMTDPERSPLLRDSFRRDDMTDEQREELRRNMRLAGRAVMRERLDEYFNADSTDQEAVLDRHIDELAAAMDAWRSRREERQRDRPRGDRERRNRPTPTKKQQKTRTESRNPDEAAQQMIYFAALRAQAQARGLSLGRGMRGFGGRGGFGGGRGGAGGGGRNGGGRRRP